MGEKETGEKGGEEVSDSWMRKWGNDGWAFDDPNGQEATLGVYQRKGEWGSVVQARAGLDPEDIEARVIAKLANRVAKFEAAVRWMLDGDNVTQSSGLIREWSEAHPIVRELIEKESE